MLIELNMVPPPVIVGDADAIAQSTTRASPKLLGRDKLIEKQVGATNTTRCARNTEGDRPTIARNVRLNVPRLVKPTAMQISVTGRSVTRRRNIARSTRRRCR